MSNYWRSNGNLAQKRALVRSGEQYEVTLSRETESQGLLTYWGLLWRRKKAITLITLLGVVVAIIVTLVQTPVYRARVSLEVQNFNSDFLNVGKVDPTAVNYEADSYMQTQLKMLQSDSLLDRVAANVPFDESRFPKPEPQRSSVVRRLLHLPPAPPLTPREQVLGMAVRTLKVRGSGMTRVIEVFADSTDARFAADFVNTLATNYIQQSLESRWSSAQHVTDWLTEQLRGFKANLEKSEERLDAYTRSAGFLSSSDKENVAEQKLVELQQELFKAQADRVAKQSKYELASSSAPDALPEVLDDGALRDYQAKYAELRRQLAELSSTFTQAHPQVKRVEAQINELRATAEQRRANILSRIKNEFDAAKRREALLENAYANQLKAAADQGNKTVQYTMLKREVDTTRQLYESMLQKVKEAGVAAAMNVSNIRVVDKAKPPIDPVSPDRKLNLALGTLGGLFIGAAFALLRERTERSLKHPGEAKFYLNVPELGLIPSAGSDPTSPRLGGGKIPRVLAFTGGAPKPGDSLELATWRRETSLTAESYRSALASILFSAQTGNGNRPQFILLTSPGPLEGKTTTATNLAIAVAETVSQTGQRVLLVDGDMRRPRLHTVFGLSNSSGFCDLLQDGSSVEDTHIEDLVRKTEIPGLYLLPGGSTEGRVSHLLYSPRLGSLLNRFRREFHTVLLDTPPMISFSDARVLARWADAVILVIRSGHTNRDAALLAKQQFEDDGTPILGTILTDWKPGGPAVGYGYNTDYFSSYFNHYNKPRDV